MDNATRKLASVEDGEDHRHWSVYLNDEGDLVLAGHDYGPAVAEFFGRGRDEYEWAVKVSRSRFDELRTVLSLGDGELLDELVEHRSGDRAAGLRDELEQAGLIIEPWQRVGRF